MEVLDGSLKGYQVSIAGNPGNKVEGTAWLQVIFYITASPSGSFPLCQNVRVEHDCHGHYLPFSF